MEVQQQTFPWGSRYVVVRESRARPRGLHPHDLPEMFNITENRTVISRPGFSASTYDGKDDSFTRELQSSKGPFFTRGASPPHFSVVFQSRPRAGKNRRPPFLESGWVRGTEGGRRSAPGGRCGETAGRQGPWPTEGIAGPRK